MTVFCTGRRSAIWLSAEWSSGDSAHTPSTSSPSNHWTASPVSANQSRPPAEPMSPPAWMVQTTLPSMPLDRTTAERNTVNLTDDWLVCVCSSPSSDWSEEGSSHGDQCVFRVEHPSSAEPVPPPGLSSPLQPQGKYTNTLWHRQGWADGLWCNCLCYGCQHGGEAGQWQYVSTKSSSVVLTGLQQATQYQVQVRARSQAGYGSFSSLNNINTKPDGTSLDFLQTECYLLSFKCFYANFCVWFLMFNMFYQIKKQKLKVKNVTDVFLSFWKVH